MVMEQGNMWNVKAFIRKHLKRGFKYACVGTTGFFLDVGILYSLVQFVHIWYITSEIVATLITFVTNYLFNTYWTYRDAMKKLEENKKNETSLEKKAFDSIRSQESTSGA